MQNVREDLEKQSNGSELTARVISGVIMMVLASIAVYLNGYYFHALVLFAVFAVCYELDNMREDGAKLFLLVGLPLLVAKIAEISLLLFLIGLVTTPLLKRLGKFKIRDVVSQGLFVYIAGFSMIWVSESGDSDILVWLILVVIASDIGAYATGKKIGKTPLAPQISPNKTVEGALGGLLLAVIASMAVSFDSALAIFAVLVAASAMVGDLFASSLKRKYGVKNSGSLIPGHGGVLDRADSFILSAPLVAALHFGGLL